MKYVVQQNAGPLDEAGEAWSVQELRAYFRAKREVVVAAVSDELLNELRLYTLKNRWARALGNPFGFKLAL